MKKIVLICLACAYTALSFGQMKIDSLGQVLINDVEDHFYKLIGPFEPGGGSIHFTNTSIPPALTMYRMFAKAFNSYGCANFATESATSTALGCGTGGLIHFYVKGDGSIYTDEGLVQLSDSTQKENIETLPSTMDKIKQLRGVTFNYKHDTENSISTLSNEIETIEELGATPEISQQIAEEQSRKRIGLVAQEVEQVFPEVIRTSYSGTKGIMYGDLVGVLIEGMKELQDSLNIQAVQIAELQQQINEIKATLSGGSQPKKAPQSTANNKFKDAMLYPNTPNPFNEEATISYRLSANAGTAAICIYDLNGRQLKNYALDVNTISGEVRISASELISGMYIYALIIDNQVIDSKRMTLTGHN